MEKNLEIYNKIKTLPNFLINNIYHIGSMFNSDDFYQFASVLDEADLEIFGTDIPHSELFTCVKNENQHNLIIEKEKFGWLLEVYYPHILGIVKDKKGIITGYEYSNKNSHSSLIYDEDYDVAIDEAVKMSIDWIKKDLEKVNKKLLNK